VCRDITDLHHVLNENAQIKADSKTINLIQSCVNHEMLTPL
jgi:hypothetical protein